MKPITKRPSPNLKPTSFRVKSAPKPLKKEIIIFRIQIFFLFVSAFSTSWSLPLITSNSSKLKGSFWFCFSGDLSEKSSFSILLLNSPRIPQFVLTGHIAGSTFHRRLTTFLQI